MRIKNPTICLLRLLPGRAILTTEIMGKEKGFALTALKSKEVQHWLLTLGYSLEHGKHRHLSLVHATLPRVLLPIQPSSPLSFPAAKQIAQAVGLAGIRELEAAVRGKRTEPAVPRS